MWEAVYYIFFNFNFKYYWLLHCELCPKRFIAKASLAAHFNVHTGEKPFECEHCQKRFGRADCLKNHVRKQHTGDV